MIHIGKPYVVNKDNKSFLISEIKDSVASKNYQLWFSVDPLFGEYLTPEVVDSYLIIVFQIAMKSGQSIKSEIPASERLLYYLKTSIMPIINRMYPDHSFIELDIPSISINFKGHGIGTGCSLGVDSFATIIDAMSEKLPEESRLTHLALFNSGQLGDNKLEEAEAKFLSDVESLKEPAQELGLPVLGINSNINEIYKDYDYPLLHRFLFSTCAFPLALQKLFKRYIFASSYPIEDFSLSPDDICHVEYIVLSMLGTESLSFCNSNPTYTRVDKTKLLANNGIAQRYLNVCWSHQIYTMSGLDSFLKNKKKLNCGICDKCLRTMFTLEVLGRLKDFENIFDIDAYRKFRSKYLVKIVANRKSNHFCEEIYDLIQEKNFKVPISTKLMAFGVNLGLYKLAKKLFGFTTMLPKK